MDHTTISFPILVIYPPVSHSSGESFRMGETWIWILQIKHIGAGLYVVTSPVSTARSISHAFQRQVQGYVGVRTAWVYLKIVNLLIGLILARLPLISSSEGMFCTQYLTLSIYILPQFLWATGVVKYVDSTISSCRITFRVIFHNFSLWAKCYSCYVYCGYMNLPLSIPGLSYHFTQAIAATLSFGMACLPWCQNNLAYNWWQIVPL
jgi:hypothetical protein